MKKKNVSSLKKELDRVFSIFIRQRDKGICFTCGRFFGWQKVQCGHFVARQHNSTRYDERNCNAQCYACNMLYGGRADDYALNLEAKYGKGIVAELNKQKRQIKQWTVEELTYLIEYYKEKIEV